MNKTVKKVIRIAISILVLHIIIALIVSALLVAIGMGEYGQPRFLEHNGCPGGDVQVWFCLMGQTVPDLIFSFPEVFLCYVIGETVMENFFSILPYVFGVTSGIIGKLILFFSGFPVSLL